jgi:hypothetical protein
MRPPLAPIQAGIGETAAQQSNCIGVNPQGRKRLGSILGQFVAG